MKTIAILGKPNVGKSSLFNRLCKEQSAITSDFSGTTRDIKKGVCVVNNTPLILLDSGGIDANQNAELESNKKALKHAQKRAELFKQVSEASLKAGADSDLVLYVVDGRAEIDEEDTRIIRGLQKKVRVFLVLNKIDNDKLKLEAWKFSALGVKEMFFISVAHNRGISTLQDSIARALDLQSQDAQIQNLAILQNQNTSQDVSIEEFIADSAHNQDENQEIHIGIIGRVNVGKSSLLNALLGQNRSIVSEIAGTTIDPVDESTEFENKTLRFIDTAGIRRAGKIEGIEKYALDRTNKALSKSHIALLVLDCSQPFVELDEKITSLVPKHNLGIIIVLNKWDIARADFKSIKQEIKYKFKFLDYAPMVCVSAKDRRNINALKKKILEVWRNFNHRIPTAKLNDIISKATTKHHLPSDRGKIVKIYYATQFGICPPQISLVMNRPNALHFSYKRYLINTLREECDFSGVPIVIEARKKSSQRDEDSAFKTCADLE
ncbi:ribosome biogenesis GTPase Der [Helicobacter himalayensis]|uniref:ribosome biogenesis GTPase Der n=1 Tax=Helicobacter himalayensis TaxID=1591088 RepID=UPI003D6E3E6A